MAKCIATVDNQFILKIIISWDHYNALFTSNNQIPLVCTCSELVVLSIHNNSLASLLVLTVMIMVPCRTSKAGRPLQRVEIASSGRARSLPTLANAAAHTHLARFASKPVPRAYVPKRARSKAGGMSGRTEPVTSQDSLAAEVLLSLCPSGFRETGNDVGDGVVESAAPLPVEEPVQSAGSLPIQQPMEPVESTPDEQVTLQRHQFVHPMCCCLIFWALLQHAIRSCIRVGMFDSKRCGYDSRHMFWIWKYLQQYDIPIGSTVYSPSIFAAEGVVPD